MDIVVKVIYLRYLKFILLNKYNATLFCSVTSISISLAIANITSDLNYENRKRELENEYAEKSFYIEYEYKGQIRKLEKENSKLHKIIDRFYETIDKFIHWICDKFSISEEEDLVRDFEFENNIYFDSEKQIEYEEFQEYEELEW